MVEIKRSRKRESQISQEANSPGILWAEGGEGRDGKGENAVAN